MRGVALAETYERLIDKAKRGEYQLSVPFDYLVLGFLPEEGTLFAELFPLGENVGNLHKKFSPEQQKAIKPTDIGTRLRILREQGLAVAVYSGTSERGKKVWQRTATGTKIYNDWKAKNNGSNS